LIAGVGIVLSVIGIMNCLDAVVHSITVLRVCLQAVLLPALSYSYRFVHNVSGAIFFSSKALAMTMALLSLPAAHNTSDGTCYVLKCARRTRPRFVLLLPTLQQLLDLGGYRDRRRLLGLAGPTTGAGHGRRRCHCAISGVCCRDTARGTRN
jgi:hypothetical protein